MDKLNCMSYKFVGANDKKISEIKNQNYLTKQIKPYKTFEFAGTDFTKEKAKRKLDNIFRYIKEDINDFRKNGGEIWVVDFATESMACTDISKSKKPVIAFDIDQLVNRKGILDYDKDQENSTKNNILKASYFIHEKVHADDEKLINVDQKHKAAGSLQEEVDAYTKQFEFTSKMLSEGKLSYDDAFGDTGIVKSYEEYFDISKDKKSFKFSKKGLVDFYKHVYNRYQQSLDANPSLAVFYDLNKDGKMDLSSSGHKYKGPKIR